ncbi:M20 family metallopeptidase [Paenibacillus sp. MMS20-IR301]|uniref:M20 family metallopeptidase n=1 Tax=Paenibacillus sp. MMS20-IR301 TaxID=2895946 RepID=UPI0028E68189|nr:M20 family metallopeptidase [Paenibacillus sp. MMS20-IR301]WNS46234.1 M20 family metallopeptidase [Paenibacillus sp. MMS20-IR301]
MINVRSRGFAVPFLQRLIGADTCNPPGNEHGLSLLLQETLQELGIASTITAVEEGRSNLEAVIAGSGSRKLMFCGHLDTVSPWSAAAGRYPPHGAVIEGNRMYGRGTSDMKSGLAAMLLAAASLHQDGIRLAGDLLFLATAGEEVDSCGARLYAEQHRHDLPLLDGLVIGEPTGSRVAAGHKGALWLRISLFGRSAHGSMPQLGLNAVEGMMELIALLHRHALEWQAADPVLGSSSLSVNRIVGGVQTNVVPDYCSIDVDIRTVPPLRHGPLLQEIEDKLQEIQLLHPEYRYQVEQLLDRSVVYTDPGQRLITAALEVVAQRGDKEESTGSEEDKGSLGRSVSSEAEVQGVPYYTDGSVLHDNGRLPVLIYGPGDPRLAHQPDEWVDIDAYLDSISFYRELAIRFLGTVQE